jgi:hypothetical protein
MSSIINQAGSNSKLDTHYIKSCYKDNLVNGYS